MARGGFISRNSGYIGHSMSRRAAIAYDKGYMPKSKWTKKAIMEHIEDWLWLSECIYDEHIREECLAEFKKITKDRLFSVLIAYEEWHHVGGFAMPVKFYGFRERWLPDYIKENKDLFPLTNQHLYGE